MQVNITLSKKEKRHYFLYLLGMLLFAVLIISFIALRHFRSPFSDADMHSVLVLQEKTQFDEAQKSVEKLMDSTFKRINKLDVEKSSPLQENEAQMGITDVNNAFKLTKLTDPRTKAYSQISRFYKMYYDDKREADLVQKNTKIFVKQFEDCSVGYRDRQQQMQQRENAMLMRNGR